MKRMIISPVVEVYHGKTEAGREYVIKHETCEPLDDLPGMQQILNRYPTIRNVYYGWGVDADTDKPAFAVDNSLRVLCDIWNHINRLNTGVYLVAARNARILNIYHKRWLNKKNKWKLLEAGMLPDNQAYIVIQK